MHRGFVEGRTLSGDKKNQAALIDVMVVGSGVWQDGKFGDFIRSTTYDPALRHPVATGTEGPHDPDADTEEELTQGDSGVDIEISVDSEKDLFCLNEQGEDVGGLGGGDVRDNGLEAL